MGVDEYGKKRLLITAKGYEYMLKDRSTQVWHFVFECLKTAQDPGQVLSLLFQIAYCEVGKPYPFAALTDTQRQLVNDFAHLGIVFRKTISSSQFYPSHIAVNMIFKGGSEVPGTSSSTSRYVYSLFLSFLFIL